MIKTIVAISLSLIMFSSVCKAQELYSNTEQAWLYNTKGYEMLFSGKYMQAREFFLKAIEKDSADRMGYFNLMEVCRALDDFNTLSVQFEKAKKVFPYDHEIHYMSGNIYQNLKYYQKAIRDYNKAIELANQSEQQPALAYAYYFNRGNSYLKLKDYPRAIKDYDLTVELHPLNHGAFTNRGMARFKMRDRAGACKDWKKAQELGYKRADTYLLKFCQ